MADIVHPGQAVLVRERAKGPRLAMAHGLLDRFLTWATKSLDPVYMYDERSGVISAVYMNQHLTVPVAVLDATTGAQQARARGFRRLLDSAWVGSGPWKYSS